MDEYIKREAALHEIERREVLMVGDKRISVDAMKSFIKNRPAADVAPVRHGRWEPYFEEVEIYNAGGVAERKQTGWICGRCKSVESITRYYKTNYCPNCGAKMDLEALQ